MKVIKPPGMPVDFYAISVPRLFVAGGISNTSNWQDEFLNLLSDQYIVAFNPRREDFDANNKEMEIEQITWEWTALRNSDIISFLFSPETLCPITLFELGTVLEKSPFKQKIVVGCHPDYKRINDIRIQLSLRNTSIQVVTDLPSLANQVKDWLQKTKR